MSAADAMRLVPELEQRHERLRAVLPELEQRDVHEELRETRARLREYEMREREILTHLRDLPGLVPTLPLPLVVRKLADCWRWRVG